jgi:hypothetical protein
LPEQLLEAGGFHLIVLQHTNCGITYLAGENAMLTRYFQMPEGELKEKKVTDPRAAVASDVALLRAIPALPGEWLVSGLDYDVGTGLVEIVVPPARIRPVTADATAAGATKGQKPPANYEAFADRANLFAVCSLKGSELSIQVRF